MISKALNDGSYKAKKSRSGGTEYTYTVTVHKWSKEDSLLQFVAIVEKNVIKTGYFNWVAQAL